MVASGPYSESYNFRHMFNLGDIRGCPPKQEGCPGSLMNLITTNPDFTKFKYMVKLARLETILNDAQANFTLFVPSDNAIAGLGDAVFMNMDDSTARHIIKSSMLDRRIPSELLEDSPASYYTTKDPPNRLFITNISGKMYINTDINVVHTDIMAINGLIHVVDKLIWPEII